MTPQEIIARTLCRLADMDPDEDSGDGPNWHALRVQALQIVVDLSNSGYVVDKEMVGNKAMTSPVDVEEYDDAPEDECDHLDYELDILTGLATCEMCSHLWYLSEAEWKHYQERMAAPYPDPE